MNAMPDAEMQGVVAVIPAHNERGTIGEIVSRAGATGCRVLVVDDAGSDGTAEAARAAGAEVLRLDVRAGNLRALQAGMARALASGAEWVVTLDADGQHAPEDIGTLVGEARRTGAVVVGSCPGRVGASRRFVWACLRALSGLRQRDLTSGFRAYPRAAAEWFAGVAASRLLYPDVPALLRLREKGIPVREAPTAIAPRRIGTSRMFGSWRAILKYLFLVSGQCLWFGLRWRLRRRERVSRIT